MKNESKSDNRKQIKYSGKKLGENKTYSFKSCAIILDEADVDEPVSWLSATQDAEKISSKIVNQFPYNRPFMKKIYRVVHV